jgi:hypothetical protein
MATRGMGIITGSPLVDDPQLGPLRDNGGPTRTIAPAVGSPAIDAGADFGLATDQRGRRRPSGAGFDIGAYERQPADPASGAASGSSGASQGSRSAFGKRTLVTLRLAVTRIPAKGPLPVVVANANGFRVTGRLAATRGHVALKHVKIDVPAGASKTIRLKLPRQLTRLLKRDGRLTLRLRASLRDPAGTTRVVSKAITPRLKRTRL